MGCHHPALCGPRAVFWSEVRFVPMPGPALHAGFTLSHGRESLAIFRGGLPMPPSSATGNPCITISPLIRGYWKAARSQISRRRCWQDGKQSPQRFGLRPGGEPPRPCICGHIDAGVARGVCNSQSSHPLVQGTIRRLSKRTLAALELVQGLKPLPAAAAEGG